MTHYCEYITCVVPILYEFDNFLCWIFFEGIGLYRGFTVLWFWKKMKEILHVIISYIPFLKWVIWTDSGEEWSPTASFRKYSSFQFHLNNLNLAKFFCGLQNTFEKLFHVPDLKFDTWRRQKVSLEYYSSIIFILSKSSFIFTFLPKALRAETSVLIHLLVWRRPSGDFGGRN